MPSFYVSLWLDACLLIINWVTLNVKISPDTAVHVTANVHVLDQLRAMYVNFSRFKPLVSYEWTISCSPVYKHAWGRSLPNISNNSHLPPYKMKLPIFTSIVLLFASTQTAALSCTQDTDCWGIQCGSAVRCEFGYCWKGVCIGPVCAGQGENCAVSPNVVSL